MMQLKFDVRIDLPDRTGRQATSRAARDVMLKLAAELVRCSVAVSDEEPAPTTKKRRRRFS